ncbi:divalent-cation tolerance protein CutA [Shewanella intestini]|uniref:Divalent cation tolerance protein CutA n=1 Tax=Shewanella intestini TaxID=2017544 RepID=A0ABS5I6P7_9GAMM|nr:MULTISPECIES: divalent-cation tolerance protein CutA [Shewanella]MBR9729576.1 divalent cation tolerance protein CutA [Shewanella intestini]MRG37646.1 divalent cation tolerance protein CutA [Shewanella sp. XMDDZSB0408]
MIANYLIVLSTFPDNTSATQAAHALVQAKLAACVQIGQAVESVYMWDGQICQSQEVPLQIKCLACHYHAIEQLIISVHPYDVPEVIATPLTQGLPSYFTWIKETTAS